LLAVWQTIQGLSRTKQAALAGAAATVALSMVLLVSSVNSERMTLLYSGLDPSHASEVVAQLDQQGVTYELRGETIFVPEADRDLVRIRLAGQGLPRQSVQGYELLDSVSAFSTTSEMYNATYWRAKEGELTRTILAMPNILSARVHIAVPTRSGFSRNSAAPTASVTVSTSSRPDAAKAEALQYLVALSVPDLDPSEVVVIDARHGIIAGDDASIQAIPSRVEADRTQELEQRILHLLEARLGRGNARVSVNVEVDRDLERTSIKSIDPDSRVLRSRTIDEMAEDSQGGAGQITVASNLPQNDGAQAEPRRSTRENTRESVIYDFTEIRTETERLPGAISKVSIAAVVNADALLRPDGTPLPPASQEEILSNFNELIAAVAGLDAGRGDQLQIEVMPFTPVEIPEMVEAPTMVEQMVRQYGWSGAQLALLALVVIVLGLGVIRPILTRPGPSALSDEVKSEDEAEVPTASPPEPDPVDLLKERAADREAEAANLLLDWLNEDRRAAVND
jgi:flagellar M-ring protein FliF